MLSPEPPTLAELHDRVQKRSVHYELCADTVVERGQQVQIGYTIELSGQSDCEDHEGPGCARCARSYADLEMLANWAIERAQAGHLATVEAFDGAWHASPRHDLRPEIVLTIHITRYDGDGPPLDKDEKGCLAALEAALHELRVKRGAD